MSIFFTGKGCSCLLFSFLQSLFWLWEKEHRIIPLIRMSFNASAVNFMLLRDILLRNWVGMLFQLAGHFGTRRVPLTCGNVRRHLNRWPFSVPWCFLWEGGPHRTQIKHWRVWCVFPSTYLSKWHKMSNNGASCRWNKQKGTHTQRCVDVPVFLVRLWFAVIQSCLTNSSTKGYFHCSSRRNVVLQSSDVPFSGSKTLKSSLLYFIVRSWGHL